MPKKSNTMEQKLRRLGARLDDLLSHARKTKDYVSKINLEELLRQKSEVEAKLKELKGTGEAALREMEEGMDKAWREIGIALVRAKDKFKK